MIDKISPNPSLLKRGIRKKILFQGVSEKMSEETEFIWFLQFDYW
jgi:hypothetical protein